MQLRTCDTLQLLSWGSESLFEVEKHQTTSLPVFDLFILNLNRPKLKIKNTRKQREIYVLIDTNR